MNIDDEDELLYGSCKTEMPFFASQAPSGMDTEPTDTKANDQPGSDTNDMDSKFKSGDQAATTFWLTAVNSNGSLAIFNLDDCDINQIYSAQKFNTAPKTLSLNNHLVSEEAKSVVGTVNPPRSSLMDSYQAQVHEILMVGAGRFAFTLKKKLFWEVPNYYFGLSVCSSKTLKKIDKGVLQENKTLKYFKIFEFLITIPFVKFENLFIFLNMRNMNYTVIIFTFRSALVEQKSN